MSQLNVGHGCLRHERMLVLHQRYVLNHCLRQAHWAKQQGGDSANPVEPGQTADRVETRMNLAQRG